MIELVSEERCIQCDVCVDVCPTNVFDAVPGGPPVIARKADCQTCFMCEVYCPGLGDIQREDGLPDVRNTNRRDGPR